MNVLVTGASGFLGSHIAETLAESRFNVRLLLRRTSSREFLKFPHEVVEGDVMEPFSLEAAFRGIDSVVHAAGLIKARNEAEFFAVNDAGTGNLITAAERYAPGLTSFVYISSLSARGPGDGTEPAKPVTAYGRSKLAGEERLASSTLAARSVVFRMPVIYGPRDPALLPVFRAAWFRVLPLLNGGRNRISIIYVKDAAQAVVACLQASEKGGKVYTPEDGSPHTWRELIGAIEAATGHSVLAIPAPTAGFQVAALATGGVARLLRRSVVFTPEKVTEMAQRAWVCSAAVLKADLGWSPRVPIDEGAALTYRWYRSEGWL